MLSLIYFLKVVLCSAVFFGYYLLALRNKKCHQFNRFYLLFTVVASWLIPLLEFQVTTIQNVQQPIYQAFSYIAESNSVFEMESVQNAAPSFNWMQLLPLLYLVIAAVILTALVVSLFKIYRIYKKYPKLKMGNFIWVNTTESGTPFSFFKYIFWNEEIDTDSVTGKQIFQHELTHVNEKHSWDKMFIQINLVIGWFNPFFWIIKKELEMIHEFIADNKAVKNSSANDFASMLLVAAFPAHQYKLTNPFFYSPIKRRLTMITQNKTSNFTYLRRLIVLPLVAIVLVLFAFRTNEVPTQLYATSKYRIVIDAGHGGTDFGCKSADGTVHEKDVTLAIVKAIKHLNTNKNIEIILTRDDDHFDDLKSKVDFINNQRADLCISIHCSDDAENSQLSGTEIYIVGAGKNESITNENAWLAQSVNRTLSNNFKGQGIKAHKQGIYILKETKCPAIIIEAGYLSNKEDAATLVKADKQELMAKSILKGVENYLAMKDRR